MMIEVMNSNFVHLSVRSDMSGTQRSLLGDFAGAAKVEEYVAKAAEMGQSAIAITDLGTMRNVYALKKACDKHGVKPIYGVEVYVCQDHSKKDVPKEIIEQITANVSPSKYREVVDEYAAVNGYTRGERNLSTLTLWAMNDEGLKNLFRLTTKSWTDGFYYKPRVDAQLLREHSNGVACGTGGANSWIHNPNLSGRRREAIERFRELCDIFGHNLVLEVRPHKLLEQKTCNDFCMELKALVDTPQILPTQGVHYLERGGLEAQKMICAIGTGKGSELSSCGLEIDSYWLRSREEMEFALLESGAADVEEDAKFWCDRVETFASLLNADFKLDPFAMIIPDIETGELSHVEYLEKMCSDSVRWTDGSIEFGPEREPYLDRMYSELEILSRPVSPDSEATFASYIVYVNEVIQMCKDLGIALGPGRGSSAGSIVNWLLGITDVDPVEHDLMFSRFISSNRIGPPDVDIDVDPSKRPLLFEKMRERWGAECVGQISTFSKFKGRVVINDVCRELKVSIPETHAVTKFIEQKSDFEDGAFETVRAAFIGTDDHAPNSDCMTFAQKHPAVVPYATQLEGKMRNLGVHPAGIVCAPKPLSEYIPMETRSSKDGDDRLLVTAFDMVGVEQCGLLKIDMLGLITVSVISNALDAVNKQIDEPLTMSNIPLDDAATLKAFEERDFSGVFQFDSDSAKRLCKGVTFPSFSTISDMTALNRPGPMDSGMAEEYIKRKADPSLVEVDYCQKVSDITADTLGVMIYQEQVMRVVGEVGLHENPDKMRKIIGKKLMDKIEAERPGFVAGAKESSPEMGEPVANRLYDDIVTFGRYGFNKCVAYDTTLHRADDSSGKLTVEEAYDIWNSSPRTPLGGKMRSGRWRVLAMSEDGRVRPHYVKGIYFNGVKPVTRFETSSGRVIEVTENHRLLTGSGKYLVASDFSVGDSLVACGKYEQSTNVNGRGSGHCKGVSYEGKGFQNGENNPAWLDGRTSMLEVAKQECIERANGACEGCGKAEANLDRFECAHQKNLQQCREDYSAYHNSDNLKYFCNSCHKKLDYEKDERKPAWSKGRPTFSDEIVSIQRNFREVKTYDLEMEGEPHNFIAGTNGGVVSHNSHSVSYAKIGYLCQYLKIHYPLEFYWAMMLSASSNGNTDKMRQYAKEANARGIRVLSPNVQKSGFSLSIDRERNAIIGALVDVKKVGEKAAKSIVENQPFDSFEDFMERVNNRSVNMGCVIALAQAGAMDELLQNVKQFVEQAPEHFKKRNNKSFPGWRFIIESLEGPDYTPEDKLFWAAEVNPMALENPYTKLLESLSVKVLGFEAKNFYEETDGDHIWVAGTLRDTKIYQDTGFGDKQLSDLEKEHESYGKSYVTGLLESDSGKALKFKIPPHVYDHCKEFAEDSEPVLMLCRADATYQKLRARFVLSLKKMKLEPSQLENLVKAGEHPALKLQGLTPSNEGYAKQENAKRKALLHKGSYDALPIIGSVVSIRTKLAGKKLQEMAWLGIISADGEYTEVTVFSSDWVGGMRYGEYKAAMRDSVKLGSIIRIDVGSNYFNGRYSCQYNGHGMEVLA